MKKSKFGDVTGEGNFSNADHLLTLREEMRDVQKIRDDVNSSKPKDLVNDLKGTADVSSYASKTQVHG